MNAPAELVCYGENPKAHLCPLDRAVLRVLSDARGFLKRAGRKARHIRRDILLGRERYVPVSRGNPSSARVVGSLRRLERLGYVQRVAGAWRLAR